MNFLKVIAVSTAALIASLSAVSATTTGTVSTGSKSVSIECTGSCEFWDLGLDPDGFNAAGGTWLSGTYGGLSGNGNSNANRLSFAGTVLGEIFGTQSASSDTISGVASLTGFTGGDEGGWTGSAQYYLAWGGFDPRFVLIKNNTAGNVFTWTAIGKGSGLSGVDGFGVLAPVPLPATGLLMLVGLAGVAGLRRKKSIPA